MKQYNTAGPGAIVISVAAAILMIAATALLLPPLQPNQEFGVCLKFPTDWTSPVNGILLNSFLIGVSILTAFFMNKRYTFVKGAEVMLPVAMCILLTSNPANTSCFSTSVVMLLVNLICLDIIMKSYHARNATTEMFAVATYLSLGSMVEYGFLLLMLVYPVMAIIIKAMRLKEVFAYLMGLLAPYWVALGFGIIKISDFKVPEFTMMTPPEGGDHMIFVYLSLGLLALISLILTLNNALLFYSGNTQVRTYNNLINLLGVACALLMLIDFDNFEAYTSTFCFTSAVAIANFFAIRHIPHSRAWYWSLLSLFILLFLLMLTL